MTAISVSAPFPILTDIDGSPLNAGHVYIGQANLDPVAFPKSAYWDASLTMPAAQPIRTTGGYPVRNGSPARIYTDGDYSIRINNKNGTLVYSSPAATDRMDSAFVGYDGGTVQDVLDAVTGPSGAASVGYTPAGTGAVPTNVQEKLRETVSVKDFGAVGDGGDETIKLQNALYEAAGKTLFLEAGKTYGYTALTIKAGTTVVSNGAIFNRLSASTAHGITIEGGVYIDSLNITTPGGTGGDKAVAIRGSNVAIGFLSITASAQGNQSSANWAVEVESSPAGTSLSRIKVGNFYSKYFSTAWYIKNASLVEINNVIVDYYRAAFYLKDVRRSTFKNVTCRYLGAASNGSPGENGMLLESSISSGSSRGLLFENWYVSDSGEHAYRLGGQKAIYDVWFKNCTAEKPGSAILGGNTSGGEWHGGCGFKVLGGNTTTTEFHENIHFDQCGVIDCNITYGSYPAGHGVNNFTPWMIVMAKNVHLSNCWTKAVNQNYVARNGILFTAVDGLYLSNLSIRQTDLVALKPYREALISGYPGYDLPIKNVIVDGGLYEVTTSTSGSGICFYYEEAADVAHENWIINGASFKGGTSAVRINTPGAGGSFTNVQFKISYFGTNVDDSTYAAPSVVGAGAVGAIIDIVASWRPTAYSPSVANGSMWRSANDGLTRIRKSTAWSTL